MDKKQLFRYFKKSMTPCKLLAHEIFEHKKWTKKILLKLLRKKSFRKRFFHSDFFYQEVLTTSPIARQPLCDFIHCPKITLENFFSRNGNLAPFELMIIASIVADRNPMRLLEIGTFDGNTTLQLALNAPFGAVIHTIDLPPGQMLTKKSALKSDLQFICDPLKEKKKFETIKTPAQIQQHLGDSTQYSFSRFTEDGPLDFIFIDGGHSYECVQSDTENALKHLSEKGCILWHDFTPHFEGVYRFLCELSKSLPLIHIEGTNFVFFEKA